MKDAADREAKIKDLNKDLKELEYKSEEAKKQQEKLGEELVKVKVAEAEKDAALAERSAELEALKKALDSREAEMLRAAQETADREEKLLVLKQDLDSLRDEKADTSDAEKALIAQMETLRKQQEEQDGSLAKARKDAETLRAALSKRSEGIASLEDKIKGVQTGGLPLKLVAVGAVALVGIGAFVAWIVMSGSLKGLPDAIQDISTQPDAGPIATTAGQPPPTVAPAKPEDVIPSFDPAIAPGARVLTFPADISIGTLSVRPWNDTEESTWANAGNAKGEVEIKESHAVRLRSMGMDAKELSALASFPHDAFWAIELMGEEVTDDTMQDIRGLTSVQDLRIMAAKVSPKALAELGRFKHLRHLSLRGIPVNNSVLETIATLETLETLDLRETGVQDSGAARLVALKNLRELTLDPEYVTDVSLFALKNALPNCKLSPEPSIK